VPFRYIQEALLKNHSVHSPYVRFNKTEGNFAVNKKNYNEADFEPLLKDGLKVGDAVLTVTKADKEQLSHFWEKHGHHYNGIIDSLRKDFNKRAKEEKRTQARNKKVEFEFGGKQYDDINKLKSEFKNILCRNPNNVPLKEA
jgi:DNA gyrase/topoisomerase IV subunit B